MANQSTALKTDAISPLINNYSTSSSASTTKPVMSLFCSFPRPNMSSLPIKYIERHPYTSQTFAPIGLSPSESTGYLVVSAPTLKGQTINGIVDPPDLSRIEAFVARGDQAVTYAPGTWHSPMIVVGNRRVDFVVTQFANGVADDDCQVVEVGGNVIVDLRTVAVSQKAKL
jgi:ureidoglycolate lyase